MYDHIIVPFDGTKDAQRAAMVGSDLAAVLGAELVLATAGEVGAQQARNSLKDHAVELSDPSVTVWLEPARTEAEALMTMTSFRPRSLICMYTHARSGLLRTVYGSTAEDLLRVLDAPVLLLGPRWEGASVVNLRHLVVAVDGSPTAEAAIPLAGAWAEHLKLDATLVSVHTGKEEFPVDLDRLAQPLLPRFGLVDKVVVENGDVVEGVLDVVNHSISPFLVMATHARSGVDRLLHGSLVAEMSGKCPVPLLVQRGPLPTVHVPLPGEVDEQVDESAEPVA